MASMRLISLCFSQVSNLFVTINSSVNILIYCIFGNKFKTLFMQIFCGAKPQVQTVHRSTGARGMTTTTTTTRITSSGGNAKGIIMESGSSPRMKTSNGNSDLRMQRHRQIGESCSVRLHIDGKGNGIETTAFLEMNKI